MEQSSPWHKAYNRIGIRRNIKIKPNYHFTKCTITRSLCMIKSMTFYNFIINTYRMDVVKCFNFHIQDIAILLLTNTCPISSCNKIYYYIILYIVQWNLEKYKYLENLDRHPLCVIMDTTITVKNGNKYFIRCTYSYSE